TNVIPGHVTLWTEMRSVDEQRLAHIRDQFPTIVRNIADRRGLSVDVDLLSHEDPVRIPVELQDLLVATLAELGLPYLRLPSFAGRHGHGFGLGVIAKRWKSAACEQLISFGVA